MERSLFAFIWRHSWRQQIGLLAVTLLSFPFLYATLELPKRIVNDAIEGPLAIEIAGVTMSRLEFLELLCAGFLAAVVVQGLIKMRLNTMKGIVAERLLRRLRYRLVERILRFPQPYLRRTSQGELVSMITAEAEPMGGVMGDALAHPVFQAGQMLTIAAFLFIQNVWLGVAATALVPLQAWLIPMLQRRVNVLNKARVIEVRALSGEIGETAGGAAELRLNGGRRRRMARIADRLGRLFDIRYDIYRKKFFMKFLNNFITQLTPFFFFSIGGYLAIQGQLSVGALVAALAAYKDLAAPWRELLNYVNRVQETSQRWHVLPERFAPRGLIDEALFEGMPETIPHRLDGPIELDGVSLRDADGSAVLSALTLSIPPGASVAIASKSVNERRAVAELIAREALPSAGRVRVAGYDLSALHQEVIVARIGHVGPAPILFEGTIGDNLTMALSTRPTGGTRDTRLTEADRAGNGADPADAHWIDPRLADCADEASLTEWWLALAEAMGTDRYLFRRGLEARFRAEDHPDLAARLVRLRPEIARRVEAAGLGRALHPFRENAFNPALPVAGNLLWATPTRDIGQEALALDPRFGALVAELGLEDELTDLGLEMLALLARVFGPEGTNHPLFLRLSVDAGLFEKLVGIERYAREHGPDALPEAKRALLMTVPFRFSAEQIGIPFPKRLKARILELRHARGAELRARATDVFEPIDPEAYLSGLSVLENALFARLSVTADAKAAKLRDLVAEVLVEHDLRTAVAALIFDVPVSQGGQNLPQVAHERIAFVRAAIKRPDILVLDRALASHDEADRVAMRARLRRLMPQTTLIFLEEGFRDRAGFDLVVEIEDGRLLGETGEAEEDEGANADLTRKIRVLERAEPFAGLDRRQLRLLAFSARWVEAEAGERLFSAGERADGAYLLVEGAAELRWPGAAETDRPASAVAPGRVIGDLSVLLGRERNLDLIAIEPSRALRIGAEELRAVVESDVAVATSLLRTVSDHLIQVGGRLREERAQAGRAMEGA
ncbi:MAG: ABC transporter transmembrane domain-containing protein [Paracoccaceae bacterium]